MMHPPTPYRSIFDSYCFGLISSRLITFIVVSISIKICVSLCESHERGICRYLSLSHDAKLIIILIKQTFFQKNIWYALVFSRENRRQEGAKFKIYLSFEGRRASVVALSLGRWSCPLGAGLQAFGLVRSSGGVLPAFLSALLLCSRCVACKYGSISRFKGVFRGFYGACVGLCWLRGLRGLWGFLYA